MAPTSSRYSVKLIDRTVGTLHQRGDYTWFEFTPEYKADPRRPVLGLTFEQNLNARCSAALRLPPWFSNLLPEGRLREWIASDRKVSQDREMELLAQVGHDLPGAVRVLPDDSADAGEWPSSEAVPHLPGGTDTTAAWRFSLAGVGLKFSMLAVDDHLTLPASGEGGDWIAKFPDPAFSAVPHDEYAMMRLAADAGINVPEVRLLHKDQLNGVPDRVWPRGEVWAYAVRRFDRDSARRPIHIEDLAQVRNVYPDLKYLGNYETVAALIYRNRDIDSLREFVRRLAFTILISNGDAHLKNWSLIYADPRTPSLAPGYDFVSTAIYRDTGDRETLGLKFGGTNVFDRINLATFDRLARRLGVTDAQLVECVVDTAERTLAAWPEHSEVLDNHAELKESITSSIRTHYASLLRHANRV